jgi:hypothetical protein
MKPFFLPPLAFAAGPLHNEVFPAFSSPSKKKPQDTSKEVACGLRAGSFPIRPALRTDLSRRKNQ